METAPDIPEPFPWGERRIFPRRPPGRPPVFLPGFI